MTNPQKAVLFIALRQLRERLAPTHQILYAETDSAVLHRLLHNEIFDTLIELEIEFTSEINLASRETTKHRPKASEEYPKAEEYGAEAFQRLFGQRIENDRQNIQSAEQPLELCVY